MTYEEFIERVHAIGYDVHLNDGVWWIETSPFFYKPVIPFVQVLERGVVKPKMHKALLGYSHLVSNDKYANQYQSVSLLNEEQLSNFGMESLSSSKRARVRKGFRLTEIRKIEAIEPVMEDMREIEISKADRTGHGEPPEYYMKKSDEWKSSIITQFNADKGKKEYWGSFYNDTLIAFLKVFLIDGTMIINYAASHTEHMNKCPNDALIFTILEQCKNSQDCVRVIHGEWSDRQSLNKYKEKFGFKKVDLPIYVKYNFNIIPIAKKIRALIKNSKKT